MPQFFKGDATELKYYNSVEPISDVLSVQKDLFYDDAYGCFVLGELLYDNNYAPLSNAIPRSVFIETFQAIFDSFISAGTYESYLSVFRKIFNDDVEVTFGPEVPVPGQLTIDVVAASIQLSPFITRYIEDNAYVIDNIVDDEGDYIVFQTIKGFESQADLERMLFEMVPDGIYTEISLTLEE